MDDVTNVLITQMIPAYRGYALDVMRDLIIFDEVTVSADERHRFKGLSRRKDNIRNEALFTVSFDTLGGVPMPDELKVKPFKVTNLFLNSLRPVKHKPFKVTNLFLNSLRPVKH